VKTDNANLKYNFLWHEERREKREERREKRGRKRESERREGRERRVALL